MDESGVYYTSLGFPSHHPDNLNNQQQGYPRDALKKCSVKGCTNALSPDDTNKMCDGCRSRHRIYASTKRARRKLEKAAIVTAVAARNGKDAEEVSSFIDPTSQPITWVTAGGQSHQVCCSDGSTLADFATSDWLFTHLSLSCIFTKRVYTGSATINIICIVGLEPCHRSSFVFGRRISYIPPSSFPTNATSNVNQL